MTRAGRKTNPLRETIELGPPIKADQARKSEMTDLVKVADSGHVRTITLNRADKKNALSNELAWGVIAAVEEAAKVDDVWVVAITGSGDAFCAGLDLSGGERFHPYTPQSAQLDDISCVGP